MENNNFVLALNASAQTVELVANQLPTDALINPRTELFEELPIAKVKKAKGPKVLSKRALATLATAATEEYDEYVRSNPKPVLDEQGEPITNDQYFDGIKRMPSNYKLPKVRAERQVKTCSLTKQKLAVLVPQLTAAANNWDSTYFKTANAHLNNLLGNVLEEFLKAQVGCSSYREFAATLRIEAKEAGVNTKSSTKPIGVFVAWVFQSITRQRISVYSNGLQKVLDKGVQTAADAVRMIEEAGGIYELSKVSKPLTRQQVFKQAIKANRVERLCSQQLREFTSVDLSAVVGKTGVPMVLVVTKTSDNQFVLNGVVMNSSKALKQIAPLISLHAKTELISDLPLE